MSGHAFAEAVGALALLGGLAAVIMVVVWQLSATHRARITASREDEYRRLAQQAVRTQEESESQLSELTTRLRAAEARIDAIEKILKEVE